MSAAEQAAQGAAAAATTEAKAPPSLIDELVATTRPQSPKEADRVHATTSSSFCARPSSPAR